MATKTKPGEYYDWISPADKDIVRKVQIHCATVHDEGEGWTRGDGAFIAALLNKSKEPRQLFRFIDERTGHWDVGYRTEDGREWFHILRQMRNTPGSGLLENLQ